MTSNLTVAEARSLLAQYICPEEPTSQKFLTYLNQARERIINSGKWKGMTFAVNFDPSLGYITLPRDAESLLGLHVNKGIYGIQSKWYEYIVGGGGKLPTDMPDIGSAVDMGENFVTMQDPAAPAQISFKTISNEDVGLEVVIYGKDANGNDIYDSNGVLGERLQLVAPSSLVTTSATFSKITSVLKPFTVGNLEIYAFAVPNGTLLSSYQPWETSPQYRRYRLKVYEPNTVVTGVCKLKYFPLVCETEPLLPANIGALKMALMALTYEDANDPAASDGYWQRCYGLLNQQLKENRGAAGFIPNIRFFPSGTGSIPRTI